MRIVVSFIVSLVVLVYLLPENTQAAKSYYGVALKNPTHVYKSTSRDSGSWKSYEAGSILKYTEYNDGWYRATVKVDGKWQTGYIHKSDVENATENQQTLRGVALKNPTHVYANASRTSSLKKYSIGSILKYRTFTSNWYEATVYINGKPKTGYINKQDVENAVQNQQTLKGIALRQPTAVYKNAAAGASWKTYAAGSILKYRTFTSNWYEATVYINGKPQTGYIHRSDVENAVENQQTLTGIALRKPTAVYKNASTQSSWKTYEEGSILKYRTFSSNWYEATVYVNGKRQTGYIHKSHVENVIPENERKTLHGIGTAIPTAVYAKASTSSTKLKTYTAGSKLKYRTFSSNWYEATVYINGKKTTGYIYKNHVDELLNSSKSLVGRALKEPTHVYSGPSRNSKTLKSYKKHATLKFRELSKNWYEATVYINGKAHTGYIHKSDVTTVDIVKYTQYNIRFKDLVDAQMVPGRAKSDGAGRIDATRAEVEYYANPANFPRGTTEFFQFLVLSEPIGLNAKEVNEKVLKGKGSLEGQAAAFINTAKKYSINEAYLIAHALHETGNGKSTLANGIPVDKNGNVTRDKNGNIAKTKDTAHIVYNMFGYGANDSCPIDCGAKYAFQQGWFTVEDSIIGGIKSIYNYISRGQDTLYKMKWNPSSPGYPQYATHVQWAVLQTKRIAEIYSLLDNYVLVFDVPKFLDNPGKTPKPSTVTSSQMIVMNESFKLQVEPHDNGKIQANSPSLNEPIKLTEPQKPPIEEEQQEQQNLTGVTIDEATLWKEPADENIDSIIGKVPVDTQLDIVEVYGDWYKIVYTDLEGWIRSEYVQLLGEE